MKANNLIYLLLLAFLVSGCSKQGYVNLNYPLAPEVVLPQHVQTIALVNRTLVPQEQKQRNVIEAITSAEIAGSDRLASDECLKGIFERGRSHGSLNFVIPAKSRLYGTGTRETPELLDWRLVKKICDSTHADALLVLETFDLNSDLLMTAVTDQVRNVLNGEVPTPHLPSQVRMNVIAFWRLYDPSTKRIIDQHQSISNLNFDCSDLALPPPDALPGTAYAAGAEYVQRFFPGYYTVKRDMYKKGKGKDRQQFETAFRRAEVANWQQAIEEWRAVANTAGSKNAGKACLNIAVAYEVLDDTENALHWAQRSYEEHQEKLGKQYAKILLDRRRLE